MGSQGLGQGASPQVQRLMRNTDLHFEARDKNVFVDVHSTQALAFVRISTDDRKTVQVEENLRESVCKPLKGGRVTFGDGS